MPALIIIGVGYAGLCAFALAAFALAGRADDAADQALGDWPAIHPEMRGEVPSGNRVGRGGQGGSAGHLGVRTNQNNRPSSHSGQGLK